MTETAAPRSDPERMGFFEHLEELRRRLIYCLWTIAIGMALGLWFWEPILSFVSAPMNDAFAAAGLARRLIFTSPLTPIKFAFQIGLFAGLFLSAPVIFWQAWQFVAPGLYRHERRFVLPFVVSSSGLLVLGSYFAHRVVLPITLAFLLQFGQGHFEAFISVNEYFGLWLTMVLWMGVIFQMPVAIFLLSWIGVVTPGFLIHYARHAVLGIVVAAALITPTGDAFTLAVFALPMILLYLLGIPVSYLTVRRRSRRQELAPAGDR